MQTVIDWYENKLIQLDIDFGGHKNYWIERKKIREQAKQMQKQDKIDFLVWLKENRWHVYKNGKWFTTTDQPYIDGEPRKTYTEEHVIKLYENR